MPKQSSLFPEQDYLAFLNALKRRIKTSQLRAAFAVNSELIHLYWQIGNEIIIRQKAQGWGSKVINRLAKDLKREFPDMTGFSLTNLKYMRSFAQAYSQEEISQRCVDQLPWRHNIVLFTKLKDTDLRFWYAQKALENGWSRNVLVLQIESSLYERQGSAITNFERTLPSPQSDLAQGLLKSEYNLDFLQLREKALERDLENALVNHMKEFLLELGVGFAFMGSQYPLEVDGNDYRLDLLFYHTRLHCYVIIDLKMGEFEPEYSGKMNFYISAVNKTVCTEEDNPTIGIILCRSKKKNIVEFALDAMQNPIAVSTHRLPDKLKENLPSIEQLEMELEVAAKALEKEVEGGVEDDCS